MSTTTPVLYTTSQEYQYCTQHHNKTVTLHNDYNNISTVNNATKLREFYTWTQQYRYCTQQHKNTVSVNKAHNNYNIWRNDHNNNGIVHTEHNNKVTVLKQHNNNDTVHKDHVSDSIAQMTTTMPVLYTKNTITNNLHNTTTKPVL